MARVAKSAAAYWAFVSEKFGFVGRGLRAEGASIRSALCGMVLAGMAPSTAFATAPWPSECKLNLAAQLPMMQTRNNKIMVPVDIDDQHYSFAIDTGGFASAIDPAIVARQNLPIFAIRPDVELRDLGGKDATHYAKIDNLTLGGRFRAQNARLMVLGSDGGTDGLLAPDYLRNFDIELDFTNKTVNLFRPHPCADRAVYWTDDYTAVPMDVTDAGHIRVDVTLDGRVLHAMLDTGAFATLIGSDTAKSLYGVDASFTGRQLRGGSGGTVEAAPAKFEKLVIGNSMLINPTLLVTDGEHAWRDDSSGLLLGMDVLRQFHLLIAYRERKLYLSPIQNESNH